MDSPDLSLIGAHGYCSQELVNLLLTGRQDIQGDPDGFPLNLELVPNHQAHHVHNFVNPNQFCHKKQVEMSVNLKILYNNNRLFVFNQPHCTCMQEER